MLKIVVYEIQNTLKILVSENCNLLSSGQFVTYCLVSLLLLYDSTLLSFFFFLFFFFLFVSCVTVSISLLMFHLISFSQHFIDHVFISISFSPQFISSIVFIFALFGCTHITWSINLIVSFTFQPIPSLEINDLWVSLDKCLILDIHYLKLNSGGFTTLCLFIFNKKCNILDRLWVFIRFQFYISFCPNNFFLHLNIPLVTFPPFRLIYHHDKIFELIIFHLRRAHLV